MGMEQNSRIYSLITSKSKPPIINLKSRLKLGGIKICRKKRTILYKNIL
jgi:hypothetical protein